MADTERMRPDLLQRLAARQHERAAAQLLRRLRVLDVDADSALEAKYDELVPVLLHEGTELCHHFLDVAGVRDYLRKIL